MFAFFFTVFIIIAAAMVVLNLSGFSMLNVETGSMQPELPVNTLVFVQRVEPSEIKKGDVITFVMNEQGTLATHRVQRVDDVSHTFITRGDANNTDDPPVIWENVVGKVQFHIPGIGRFFEVVTSSENKPVVIIIIAILVIGMFVFDYAVKIIGKNKRKKQAAPVGEQDAA